MPKASKATIDDVVVVPGFEGRYAELLDHTVGFERYSEESDLAPLFVGLPDDACRASTWATSSRARSRSRRRTGRPSRRVTPTWWAPVTRRSCTPAPSWSSSARLKRLNETMAVVTRNMEAASQ